MPDFAVKTAFTAIDKFSPVMGHMNRAVNKTFGAMGHGMKILSGPLAGLVPALSVVGIVEFGSKCIDVFELAEAAVANVEAGLKSTGGKIGLVSSDFVGMATKMSETGLFGKTDILQNATAQLLTFTGITKANFERVQLAATDVAAKLHGVAVTGENLHGVAIMMGKMMEDPIKGLTAAKRIGISFSASEEAMVTSMVNANNTLGAQNYMLGIIEKQYGGTSAALAKTGAGMDILAKHKMANTMVMIGQQLGPVKDQLFEMALFILPLINQALPIFFTWVKKLFPVIVGLGVGMVAFKIAVMGVYAAQMLMLGAGWLKYLFMMRSFIFTAIVQTKLWAAAQWLVNTAMSLNPISLVIIAVTALGYALYDLYNNWDKYSLNFQIWANQWVLAFRMAKMELYDLLNTFGLMSEATSRGAKIEYLQTLIQGMDLRKKAVELENGVAPNQTEAEGKYNSNTNVNVYSNGTQATADVLPKRGATINFANMGVNP